MKSEKYNNLVQFLGNSTEKILRRYFDNFDLIVKMNMGNSMAIKECLDLHIDLLYKYQESQNLDLITHNYSSFLTLLTSRLNKNAQYLK